ncbi:MAG: FlgD immunoglobulin-like domain containing protein [bacterium]|nr:FlgD immunoglobulin-like domain containing protein [bacterium]
MKTQTRSYPRNLTAAVLPAVLLSSAAAVLGQTVASGTVSVTFSPSSGSNQMAVWLQDAEGEYLRTLWLTDFIGRRGGGNRTADTTLDTGSGNRPDALPVWAHRRNTVDSAYGVPSLYPPPHSKPSYPADIDAVSEATPDAGTVTVTRRVGPLPANEYGIIAEVNRSFQLNAWHSYSFYRGQPSVLFGARVRFADRADSAGIPEYGGYGSPDGSDGWLRPPDSTITTAADRLSLMPDGFRFKVVFVPDASGADRKAEGRGGPAGFALHPNHPNPFNSATTIPYELPSPGTATLDVTDVLGRRVRRLLDGERPAGSGSAIWDGRDDTGMELESGVYLFVLNTKSGGRTVKALFLK